MNIGAQPRPPVDVYQSPVSSATTIALGPPAAAATDVTPADADPAPADADPAPTATGVASKDVGRPSGVPRADKVVDAGHAKVGDTIGSLSIPALKRKLPIIEGTGDDELKRGVGHFSQSVLPGGKDNCVLSGHRDTVFRGLGKLKKGDRFVVKTSDGTFTYEISQIRIVDKDDKTVIVPADHAVLTVTTCYPFNYVGSAPDRYVLVADLVTDR